MFKKNFTNYSVYLGTNPFSEEITGLLRQELLPLVDSGLEIDDCWGFIKFNLTIEEEVSNLKQIEEIIKKYVKEVP